MTASIVAPSLAHARKPLERPLPSYEDDPAPEELEPMELPSGRGLLISGGVLLGLGVVGVGVGIAGLRVRLSAAANLRELSTNQSVTGFPEGDYDCRSGGPRECPPTQERRYQLGGGLMFAGAVAGALLLISGIPLLAVGVNARRRAKQRDEGPVALRSVGPTLIPGGAGASLSLAF